jgi:hypothetical protein
LISLRYQPPDLSRGVAAGYGHDIRLGKQLADQFGAVTVAHPGVHLAVGHAEGNCCFQRVRGVLAEEVVGDGMPHLDRTVLDGIEYRRSGDDFPAGEDLNLKLSASGFSNPLGHVFGTTVNGVEALRKAGRQAPLDGRGILGNRGHGHGAGGKARHRHSSRTNVFPLFVSSSFYQKNCRRIISKTNSTWKKGFGQAGDPDADLIAGHSHLLNQDRTDLFRAADQDIVADRGDVPEHVAQIAGNGDAFDRMCDFTIFDPRSRQPRANNLRSRNLRHAQATP